MNERERYRPAVLAVMLVVMTSTFLACPPATIKDPALRAAIATRKVQAAVRALSDATLIANASKDESGRPLLADETTRKIGLFCYGTAKTLREFQAGWAPSVLSGLDGVKGQLSPSEHARLDAYIEAIRTVIQEVTRGGDQG